MVVRQHLYYTLKPSPIAYSTASSKSFSKHSFQVTFANTWLHQPAQRRKHLTHPKTSMAVDHWFVVQLGASRWLEDKFACCEGLDLQTPGAWAMPSETRRPCFWRQALSTIQPRMILEMWPAWLDWTQESGLLTCTFYIIDPKVVKHVQIHTKCQACYPSSLTGWPDNYAAKVVLIACGYILHISKYTCLICHQPGKKKIWKNVMWICSSGWWLNQPIWKICSSKLGSSSPIFGVKIPKIFELPPPSYTGLWNNPQITG